MDRLIGPMREEVIPAAATDGFVDSPRDRFKKAVTAVTELMKDGKRSSGATPTPLRILLAARKQLMVSLLSGDGSQLTLDELAAFRAELAELSRQQVHGLEQGTEEEGKERVSGARLFEIVERCIAQAERRRLTWILGQLMEACKSSGGASSSKVALGKADDIGLSGSIQEYLVKGHDEWDQQKDSDNMECATLSSFNCLPTLPTSKQAPWLMSGPTGGSPPGLPALSSAELAHRVVQLALGVLYLAGGKVAVDTANAVAWLRKSAEQGQSHAQHLLGCFLFLGTGVPSKDPHEAVFWFQKSAEQGIAGSQFCLGGCLHEGEGVPKRDPVAAVFWYRKAAAQRHRSGQNNLGLCFLKGEGGLRKDPQEAAKLFAEAAAQGCGVAQSNLGVCLLNGKGVRKDCGGAVAWFRKAVAQGRAEGQNGLGLCYERGYGVERNVKEALLWYRKSAAQGYKLGRRNLRRLRARVAVSDFISGALARFRGGERAGEGEFAVKVVDGI